MPNVPKLSNIYRCYSAFVAVAACSGLLQSYSPVQAQVIEPAGAVEQPVVERARIQYNQDGPLADQLKMPLYTWSPAGVPKAVIVAVHGMVMHGKSFSGIANLLAAEGYVVVATDLRGYGRCLTTNHQFCNGEDCKEKTNYDKSFEDVRELMRSLRKRYASTPLFCMGESLGGSIALRIASTDPELINGLVLSAPAIKPQSFIDPSVVATCTPLVKNPRAQMDLTKYMSRCASNDPEVIAEMMAEPLVRKHLSMYELLQASAAVHKTINYVADIPSDIPVLIMQGSEDRCVKPEAVMTLISTLQSSDQTVRWFHKRGHILIETAHLQPDTAQTIVSWINSRATSANVQAKLTQSPQVSEAVTSNSSDSLGIVATIKALTSRITGHNVEE